MEVGILYKGNSLIEPIEGIELKRCITWKQLAKYNIRVIENVKKEDIEKVKQLPKEGSTYSIGACDAAIKNITLYVKSLYEVLNEKDAVLKEKEKSIKILQETTETNVKLTEQIEKSNETVNDLRERIKELKLELDKSNYNVQELEKTKITLTDKLSAETRLRKEAETKYQQTLDQLGYAMDETDSKVKEKENVLTSQYTNEIERIKNTLKEKSEIIETQATQIENLNKINEELSKSGAIPDILYNHQGKNSKIIGFCGQGSYGVSSVAYTTYKILSQQYNCLVIDLDFKGGNIWKYLNSDNKAIENVLKGGGLLKQHILKTLSGKVCDYIGGVNQIWTPYEILNLPWDEIFDNNYDFIICDCGIYNSGYDIQTKVCENIIKNGQMFFVHKDPQITKDNCINILNFSTSNIGIPFISSIISNNSDLFSNSITRSRINELVVNTLVKD